MNYTINDILEVLSESTSDELFNINLMLVTEKATKEQYRLNAFKKKFQYNSQKKTIIVDGEEYRIDLDIKNPFIIINGEKHMLRTTCADKDADDPIIYLDSNFFKLKNPKRREAVLQHEIGHLKLHNINTNSKHLDRSKISEKLFDDEYTPDRIRKMTINTCKLNNINSFNKEKYDEVYKFVLDHIKKKKETYLNLASMTDIDKKIRDDIFMVAKSYENSKSSHSKAIEFEADRYAANKTSESSVKKAIRERHKYNSNLKQIKKDESNTIKMYTSSSDSDKKQKADIVKNYRSSEKSLKKTMVNQHNNDKYDYESRISALKDDKMRKSKIYK